MSKERVISEAVLERQRKASDPGVSAWVSANAGSGKTHVLAQRVIRLLLSGIDPAKILCITFTKAAAGTMANRVFDELRAWTAFDDVKLIKAMKDVGARDTGEKMRARARKLFALALETPGGLKVQTIHAFCTHILHLFPFEANVAARFSVLDEAQEAQLLDKMTNAVLLDAAAKPESDTGRALQYAITAAADLTFRDLIGRTIGERDAIEAWLASAGGLKGAARQLSRGLNIDPADSEDKIATEFLGKSGIAASEWPEIAVIGAAGKKTDREQADRFASLASLSGTQQIERYIEIFCTKTSGKRATIFTNDIKDIHGALCDRLHAERDRIWALIERRRAVAARERTLALVAIVKAVLDRFRAEKDRRGLLDFEDQIDKTHALLSRISATWVHYKLDRGIDHVLIDEAQDTSPKQWGIVRHLVAEFFAGQGAAEQKGTIFAVGDEKQSIFSFQGAAPAEFESMRREFETMASRSEQAFHHVRFDTSLRSGENVLSAVDIVFRQADIAISLTQDAAGIPGHIALASAAPGEVEIWDTEKPLPDSGETDPWNAPFDNLTGLSPVVRLAERIAKSVCTQMTAGRRPGEVLVLVKRRGALFEAIIRSLKNAAIPVAGADRLVLTEHIAVMDLLVLADTLLLPHDDLALAAALKSPLFGFDDDDIFALAYGRGDTSLREALARQSASNPKFAKALGRLDEFAARTKDTSPFAFYAHLLGAGHGRQRFLARLGHEAADALDEFLSLALEYERGETPTLQGFVDWLRAAKSEIKRDMEMERDEVRVMTVHGAKGLEAPVVYLADTTTRPEGYHPPPLLLLAAQTGAPPLIWVRGEKDDIGPMNDARQAARAETRDEYRRLLYVAMTRAAERLIVCGIQGKNKLPGGCWYELVRSALEADCIVEPAETGGGEVLRYRKGPVPAAEPTPPAVARKKGTPPPSWLTQDAPPEIPGEPTITPSSSTNDDVVRTNIRGDRAHALLRGSVVHRLLQSLPDIPAANRAKAMQDYLSRSAAKLPAEERKKIAEQMMLVLEDRAFYELFTANSRAEVPIIGRVEIGGRRLRVSSQVDRLAVTQSSVLIGDFKTNRPPPRRIAEVPPSYVKQLALYRAVLQKIYPNKTVRAALIWTEVPDLMELSADDLEAALA
jgi:ATP-dependent helicase/nuclease subunit A